MSYSNSNNTNGEIYQAVEPELHPLRSLWWLLGALIVGGLVWGLMRACTLARTDPSLVHETPEAVATEPAERQIGSVLLSCGGTHVSAEIFDGHLVADIGGENFTMPEVVSADGAKYSDGSTTLWQSHDNWMLIHNEGAANEEQVDCHELNG